MGLIEKWNNFARKTIYINHTLEIPVGRLVFAIIVSILAFFKVDAIAWVIPLFAIKKKQKIEKVLDITETKSA